MEGKKNGAKKNIGLKKILGANKILCGKKLDEKKSLGKIIFGREKLSSKQELSVKKIIG